MNRLKAPSILADFFELVKAKVTLLVTFTTFAGYILFTHEVSFDFLFPVVGVLLLAFGSASLNQFQERKIDAVMPRTLTRPIPSDKISPTKALIISISLLGAGSILLFLKQNFLVLSLGLFSVLWYNGIYTYLKKKTAFAVVPGSLTGAIPPLIGWVSGGGYVFDIRIISLAAFLFIWQIPHFWLLLMKYGDDYKLAGLPSLTNIFNDFQIRRINIIWVVATVISAHILFFVLQISLVFLIIVFAVSIILVVINIYVLVRKEIDSHILFICLNIYTIAILLSIIINSLV